MLLCEEVRDDLFVLSFYFPEAENYFFTFTFCSGHVWFYIFKESLNMI